MENTNLVPIYWQHPPTHAQLLALTLQSGDERPLQDPQWFPRGNNAMSSIFKQHSASPHIYRKSVLSLPQLPRWMQEQHLIYPCFSHMPSKQHGLNKHLWKAEWIFNKKDFAIFLQTRNIKWTRQSILPATAIKGDMHVLVFNWFSFPSLGWRILQLPSAPPPRGSPCGSNSSCGAFCLNMC